MGRVINQSARAVIITYIGIAFGAINTLWLFPAILKEEEIGLIRTIINIATIFSTFAVLGAGSIPFRFFPFFNDIKNKHNGFLFFLLTLGFSGFTLFLIFYLNFNNFFVSFFIKNAKDILPFTYSLIPFTLILLLINIFEAYNIIQLNPVLAIFTRETLSRFFLSINLILFAFINYNFNSFINFLIASYGIILIILIVYTYRKKYLFLTPDFTIFKSKYFKEISVYGSFILMGNALGIVIINLDTLFLSAYSGFRNVGIYTISFFIATFIEIPKKSLSQVLIPLISQANKDNDIKLLNLLYKKSGITQLLIGGIIFLVLWINIDNIFKLIPKGSIYSQGKWVVFFIGMSKMFDMFMGINMEIVGTSKYYKFDLGLYPFIALFSIAANLIFIPIYGITGAAIATFCTMFLINLIRFLFLLLKYEIQPFSYKTLIALFLFGILFLINKVLPTIENHFILDIIFRSLIITTIFSISTFYLNISKDVNSILSRFFRILLKK